MAEPVGSLSQTSKKKSLIAGAAVVGLFLLAYTGLDHYRAAFSTNLPPLVDDAAFQRLLQQGNTPVLAEFWASWCRYCRALDPHVAALAGHYAGRVRVVRVDYDAAPQARARHAVTGTPTLLMIKQGRAVARLDGSVSERALFDFVERALAETKPKSEKSVCVPAPGSLGYLPICTPASDKGDRQME